MEIKKKTYVFIAKNAFIQVHLDSVFNQMLEELVQDVKLTFVRVRVHQ